MKYTTKMLTAVALIGCLQMTARAQSAERFEDLSYPKPGYTTWYLIDMDNDGSPDLMTKDADKAEKLSKKSDQEIVMVRAKEGKKIQVHILMTGDVLSLNIEEFGVEHSADEKVLRSE